MRQDHRGNPVTITRPATLDAIDRFTAAFLAYGTDLTVILGAAEADPAAPFANACAAMLHMFGEDRGAPDRARPFAEAAIAGGGTDRERTVAAATMAWVAGDLGAALDLYERAARENARDLFTAKVAQVHALNAGAFGRMLRIAQAVGSANADDARWHAMRAFPLEQLHRLDEAAAAARTALDLDPSEPWAHHALAHVMETRGQVDDGIAMMRAASPHWAHLNSFMRCHNWWHLALYHLDRDETDEALRLFDTRIWGVEKGYSQDQAGATALLVRLELMGVTVVDRLADVGAHVAARGHDHVLPFLDLHYVAALARTDPPAGRSYARGIAAHTGGRHGRERDAWAVAAALARGIVAQAEGDGEGAVAAMAPVIGHHAKVGGSHAQRDLFDQIYEAALIQSGRWEEAALRVGLRRSVRPGSPHLGRLMARVEKGVGL
jgi:tetratricopeptide (TPR) repeat protein